jgi:branched-chain amino acid transport system ATP-binding protein
MIMPPLLQAIDVRGGYGSNEVLRTVSLAVAPGQICGLIGPNGAGKTTFLKALYGLLTLRHGRVLLNGEDITHLPARERLSLGIGYVPQERNVFPNLTVMDNLELAGTRLRAEGHTLSERLNYVFELFPKLAERRRQRAGSMSGGEQRMVAIGLGLITKPRVLLLDEPTTGLAPIYVRSLMQTIRALSTSNGIGTLLVEQNIASLVTIADTLTVMKGGKLLSHEISPLEIGSQEIWQFL